MEQSGLVKACFALLLAISLFVVQGRAQTVAAEAAPTHVFVVNTQDASVSLVELATLKEVKRFTVGPRPYGVAVSRDGDTVAVGVEDEEKIKFYGTTDFRLKGEVHIGRMFNDHLALTPDGGHFVLANFYSDDVVGIDAVTLKEAFRIKGASAPHVIKYGPLKRLAYITCKKITGIAIIDSAERRLVQFHQLNVNPRSLTFSPDESKLYFGSFWVDGFFELETKTGKVTRLFAFAPPPDNAAPQEVTYHGVEAVAPHIVLAANEGRSYIEAVDVNSGKLLDRLTAGIAKPCCIERIPDPTGAVRVLVSNIGDGTLQLVEMNGDGRLRTLGKVGVGRAPKRVAFFSQKASGRRTTMIDFSMDKPGEAPRNVTTALTGNGNPGKWVVLKDGAGNVLAQTDEDATSYRFPLAIFDQLTAKDADISVRFKPVSGRKDQAAGLVWRLKDKDNYYIVRANALENNVVLYKVQNGRREDLPLKGAGRTYGKDAKVPKNEWSELRVTAKGNLFTIYLNGQKLYEVEDGTFTEAGKVGVWTKADSVTYFDDLKVVLTASGQTREAGKQAEQTPVIVFVCEHGAAKSVLAAAHFNKLAGDRGLNYRAIARGADPDEEIALLAAKGLQADGLKPGESAPRKISKDDLVGARRVITFCLLPDSYPGEVKVESWDGVPSVSENYGNTRDWLVGRINRLLEELEVEK